MVKVGVIISKRSYLCVLCFACNNVFGEALMEMIIFFCLMSKNLCHFWSSFCFLTNKAFCIYFITWSSSLSRKKSKK